MKKLICLLALSVAGGAIAQTDPAERRALLIKVITENGCTMNEDQADDILPGHGFDQDEVGDIIKPLMEEGLAEVSNDTLTLLTPDCS